ncbi:MAG TPA: hypothetical protein VFN51_00590 [Candidatus Saccharimonadales bacterium]|nr:hypothetical protein [Candidatus Saccharimonadales bacterium]
MTRFLSEALTAKEPAFRRSLSELEQANGYPSTDIRLTSEINLLVKEKIRQLGLDQHDTTSEELYAFLKEKVRKDELLLTRRLRSVAATHVSAAADPVAGLAQSLQMLPYPNKTFALKSSVLKSLLKQMPLRRSMKALGFRSAESMLKREQPVLILSAAWLSEGPPWHKRFVKLYKKLTPTDFEDRTISVIYPQSAAWRVLASEVVKKTGHNILSFKELGALILLPLPEDYPEGVMTASTCMALHEMNEIRAGSTFLKISQTKKNFGSLVIAAADSEPHLNSKILDRSVPWNLVQHYYSRLKKLHKEEVFEPYLRLEDMVWHPVEKALASIEPELSFWQGTAFLGLIHQKAPVSMNIVDCALGLCNNLNFDARVTHFFKRSLWHELLLRYMNHEPVEQSVISSLQPQLAEEGILV